MAIYFDYETTAPNDNCFDPEQKDMFVVSYVLIVAFHQDLNLNRVIVQCSFAHSLEQLTTIDYLTSNQMSFIDINLVTQLKDAAQEVSRKKCKNAVSQIFSIGATLIKNTLLSWFNKEIKSQNLQINIDIKNKYERKHPIQWDKDICTVCKKYLF